MVSLKIQRKTEIIKYDEYYSKVQASQEKAEESLKVCFSLMVGWYNNRGHHVPTGEDNSLAFLKFKLSLLLLAFISLFALVHIHLPHPCCLFPCPNISLTYVHVELIFLGETPTKLYSPQIQHYKRSKKKTIPPKPSLENN